MPDKNKTKIICTIGPASRSPEMLADMMRAGMDIARLNFSHGSFADHKNDVLEIRKVAREIGKPLAIMADLPGPKIRIGELADEQLFLKSNETLILTTASVIGTKEKISVNLPELPSKVTKGTSLFLNDGFIQLEVLDIEQEDVLCRIVVGGPLRSRKGLNIPDVDLGVSAFTETDMKIAEFALGIGVDALSQSFVEKSEDIRSLRKFANNLGYAPYIIAKIERSHAVDNLDAILHESDGIMVARGDLGVEIPIARIPVVQKQIVRKANRAGKPVITATQMLESMIYNRLPTRAEATDAANAILDGSDCVMLSGESAVGKYPIEAVGTLRAIAVEVEKTRATFACKTPGDPDLDEGDNILEIIASTVEKVIHRIKPAAVIVPTHSGITARNITRYRLPVWVLGVSSQAKTCQELIFSYGILPILEPDHPNHWRQWIRTNLQLHGIQGDRAILTEGPSSKYPDRNDRMEIIDLLRE
ncbi:MAG: pyruvate kinase [Desulforhopalus sp.]